MDKNLFRIRSQHLGCRNVDKFIYYIELGDESMDSLLFTEICWKHCILQIYAN